MAATKFDPFALVGTSFFDDLSRLFDQPGFEIGSSEGRSPRVDVAESDEEFVIRAEMPGIDPDSIDVSFELGVLSINGSRTFASDVGDSRDNGIKYRRREIHEGSLTRKIRLSEEVDANAITATSDNGILEVIVPKQPAPLPHKVTVTVQR